jgi:hypothetical protein
MPGYESKYHFDATATAAVAVPASTESPSAASVAALYASPLFQSELSMCARSAELYPKNYYAWMHRQWLVERLRGGRAALEDQLQRVGEWTESHINDYSGFFHRQVLWNEIIHTLASAGSAADQPAGKKTDEAAVHANLPILLRHWSKPFPQHAFVADAQAVAASSAPAAPLAAASSPTSASSAAALHSALARCSFCSLFASSEWSHLSELQLKYPGHESLWMYRRFVWHVQIAAIQQHSAKVDEAAATSATVGSSFPAIPAWLHPLIHRELSYADFQIADLELSNYAANRVFALLYRAWVAHSALTLIYQTRMRRHATTAAAEAGDDPFPLMQQLSPPHRSWYLSILLPIFRIQPDLMQREHWKQRTLACNDS